MEGQPPSAPGDAERWASIREVLHQALELPADQRPAYLDGACQGDAGLRAEIESLIAASEGTAWIDRPVLSSSLNTATLELDSLAAGQRIGPYQVMEKLGQGGMGVVYKAVDTRLDRTVALKVLSRPDGNATDRSRFLREAKAASALNHPNIVTIYEYDSVDSLDFIAMEFIPGATLHHILAQGSTPLDSLLEYARQVASALARAHAAGIVHRDLKPNNIMVTAEGVAKVLDFGLAKRETSAPADVDATETQALTRVGAIVGTPAYMSPEQAMGEPADYRSDIFSFGIILYEMACGRRPFQGSNPQATLHQIASVDPPAVAEVNRSVPRELASLIERCLKKKKEERLQSMAAVAGKLAAMVQPRAPATSSRRRMLAASVLVAVGLAAGVWYSRKPAPSRERALICSLEAQPLNDDGQPAGAPHLAAAGETFLGKWHFRLRAQPVQAGHLYLIDEGPDQAGVNRLSILYPPTGSAAVPLPPGRPFESPWYRLEGNPGTERLWIVWAQQPVGEFSAAIFGGGQVVDTALEEKIRGILTGLLSQSKMVYSESAGAIQLRGTAGVLGALLELRHG